ncbi:MAG: pilin [Patescibacteria group bacterium]
MKKVLIIAALGSLFLVQNFVEAAPLTNGLNNLKSAVGEGSKVGLSGDLSMSVGTVISGLLSLVGTIFLVLTVWAGITWMTAQGNEEKVSHAKSMIQQAVIGLVVVMAAYAITAFVTGRISSSTGDTSVSCTGQYGGTCKSSCTLNFEIEAPGTDCPSSLICCMTAP